VPILIGSWVILGKNVTVKTLIASTVLTGFMEGLDLIFPKFTENPLMAAVLGGILIGIGIGVLFLKGFSMGGTDLLSIMIGKYLPNISVGYILMLCDGIVVIIAAIVFKDLEVFLYSIITVAVASKAIDFFMEGMNHARVIFIITNKGNEIADKLNSITQNGCTLMSGTGTYTGEGKDVLMAVVHPNTTAETLSAAREIDPSLFAFIASAAEVHGKGFKYYNANANSTKVIPQ